MFIKHECIVCLDRQLSRVPWYLGTIKLVSWLGSERSHCWAICGALVFQSSQRLKIWRLKIRSRFPRACVWIGRGRQDSTKRPRRSQRHPLSAILPDSCSYSLLQVLVESYPTPRGPCSCNRVYTRTKNISASKMRYRDRQSWCFTPCRNTTKRVRCL